MKIFLKYKGIKQRMQTGNTSFEKSKFDIAPTGAVAFALKLCQYNRTVYELKA